MGFLPQFFSRNRANFCVEHSARKLSYPFGKRSAAHILSAVEVTEIYEEPRGIKEIKQSVYLHSLNPLPSASVRR